MAVDQAGNRSEKVLSIYGQEDVFIQLTSDLPFTDVSKNDDGKRIETESDTLKITGTVKAPQGLQELRIKLREAEEKGARWSSIKRPFDEESRKELFFDETLQLDFGRNEVVLQAFDSTGKSAEYVLTAFRRSPEKSFDWQNLEEFFAQFCCGEMYGVIIGIEESQDQQFQVVFAANDARELYEILKDPDYGRVPQEHLKLLINEEATKDNIQHTLSIWLKDRVQAEDTVLVYYAGHDLSQKGKSYWIPYQAEVENLSGTALQTDEIAETLKGLNARRMVILLEASAQAAPEAETGFPTLFPSGQSAGKENVTMSASNSLETLLKLKELQHGVFTFVLLQGLKGDADSNQNGVIEVDEVWNYLKYQVMEISQKNGTRQMPVFQGTLTSGIPLTFNVPFLQEKLRQQQETQAAHRAEE